MTNVATLQTAADLSASITAQGISSLVPAGVILAFGGAAAPTGWLLCNGAAISRVTYSDLFAAIGTAHGYGDNVPVTGTFNLPDYRGRFIRGRDGTIARDPDRAARTAANTGGNTGDAVGSVQTTATKTPGTAWVMGAAATSNAALTAHKHELQFPGSVGGGRTIYGDYTGAGGGNIYTSENWTTRAIVSAANPGIAASMNIDHTHSVSISSGGDNESRPLNAYVNYIIKI